MSGAQSTLIAVGALGVLSVWVLAVLRPWVRPQHARRYRPDPVEVAAVMETAPFADDPHFWVDRTVPFAEVAGRPPWDLEEEATARAEHGELVFGDSRGWQSGGCLDEATLRRELRLVDELDFESSGPLGQGAPEGDPGLPASGTELGHHNGLASPRGPAGAGAGSEPSGVTARPAPGSWLDGQLADFYEWLREQWRQP